MIQDETNQKEWNATLLSHEHAEFLQSYEWGEFQKAIGRKTIRLADSFQCSASVVPLIRGQHYIYAPRGPLFLTESNVSKFYEEAREYSQSQRAWFFRCEPVIGASKEGTDKVMKKLLGYAGGTRFKETRSIQPKNVQVVDLSKDEDRLLSEMHAKTRYNIRLAEKKGVQVQCLQNESDLTEGVEQFLALAQKTSHRHEFRLHPDEYYRKMVGVLGPKQGSEVQDLKVMIYSARYGGAWCSAAIIVRFGDTATYVHGGSDDTYREVMSPQLLHWTVMKDMKRAGVRCYDLGGVSLPSDGECHSWAGITRFKQGFGGSVRSYPGTYDLIFNPVPYTLYQWVRNVRR